MGTTMRRALNNPLAIHALVFLVVVLGRPPLANAQGFPSAVTDAIRQMNAEVSRQIQAAADINQKQQQINDAKGVLAEKAGVVATVIARENELEAVKQNEQAKRAALRDRIVSTAETVKKDVDTQLGIYKTLFVVLTTASVLTALVAAIAGFMNFSKIAGICSLVTTAALILPNVFGVRDKLNFFQYCSSQSYALALQAKLPPEPTVDDVSTWQKRLFQLMDIVSNPPKEQDPESWTNRLIQK